MEVQAALGSDIALVFDECTPFHVTREYTERSMERTHRLARVLPAGDATSGPRARSCTGSSRVGSSTICVGCRRRPSPQRLRRDRHRGRWGRRRRRPPRWSWTTAELERVAPDGPRHLLGIGDVDDLIAGVELGIDTFDWRSADRAGAPRRSLGGRSVEGVARRPGQGPVALGARADPRGVARCPACAGESPRLPALPAARRRADRAAAGHAAQPVVHRRGSWKTCGRRSTPARLAEVAAALRGGAAPAGVAGGDVGGGGGGGGRSAPDPTAGENMLMWRSRAPRALWHISMPQPCLCEKWAWRGDCDVLHGGGRRRRPRSPARAGPWCSFARG